MIVPLGPHGHTHILYYAALTSTHIVYYLIIIIIIIVVLKFATKCGRMTCRASTTTCKLHPRGLIKRPAHNSLSPSWSYAMIIVINIIILFFFFFSSFFYLLLLNINSLYYIILFYGTTLRRQLIFPFVCLPSHCIIILYTMVT